MVGSILGHAVPRGEDGPLVTGAARFLEDVPVPGAVHAAFVRAVSAHARIRDVDPSEAERLPGVIGVFAAADLALPSFPPPAKVPAAFARPPLALEVVRFVGEPLAVVVAESRAAAEDAAEVVAVDHQTLPAVTDPLLALAPDAPLLFPDAGTNLAREHRFGGGDPLEGAEVVVRARFVNQRLAPVPMEPNGILAVPDEATGGLEVWVPHQAPFSFRDDLIEYLDLEDGQVRVIAPAIGGGFGAKADTYPEQLAAAALALRLGRPVRYIETRSENLVSMTHGRAQVQRVELGAARDGRLSGLRLEVVADMGAYPAGSFLPGLTRQMAAGVYRLPRLSFHARSVVTNTTPIGAYRGAGRPEAAAAIERAMDLLARELGADPVDLRRRNLIRPDEFPHTTPAGSTYDTGDYRLALDRAVELTGYHRLRREQAERRRRGGRVALGIGVSTYVEVTAWGSEFGSVEVHTDGTATVRTGLCPQGQGHETALAQLVSGTLGIPVESVRVVHSDTREVPRGEGTMGSRSLQLGGSAALRAAEGVLRKARTIAARVLEAAEEDLAVFAEDGGGIGIAGAPTSTVPWKELAAMATDPVRLPAGLEPGLAAAADFDMGERNTFPFGAHVAVVEVDVETGSTRPLRHVAVDDCGRVLNPMLVQGQVHGGVAQGIAQALFEEVRYDEDGTPLTASLASYGIPGPRDLPPMETSTTETPTPLNPLGAKGIGESGAIGSTPAVQNAVVDALVHLGVRHVDLPLSPERVWRAIREAPGGS